MKVEFLSIHQQDTFDDSNRIEELRELPLHVYLICRTPVIRLDIKKTAIREKEISLTFFTNIQGIRKELPITTVNSPEIQISRIASEYPYNIVETFDENDNKNSHSKSNLLLKYLSAQQDIYLDEFDMEVLYVGQAFGENGSRITIDRLRSHDKAQKIYFDTQQKYPDYEIWFAALVFTPQLLTMFRPLDDDESKFDKELKAQEMMHDTGISFDQQITVAEAALIKYFNTYEYNKEYLNFPSQEHKSYNEIYLLDFNSVGVELTSGSIHTRFWSKSIPPSFIHCKAYFLHSDEDRKSMFQWQ